MIRFSGLIRQVNSCLRIQTACADPRTVLGTLYVIQHTWIYLVHDSAKLISKVCTDNDSDGGESVCVRWFRPPVQSDLEVIACFSFEGI